MASATASRRGLASLPPACGNTSVAAEATGSVPVTWDLARAAVSSGPSTGMSGMRPRWKAPPGCGRNVPGVHGQAIHVNDPGQRALRSYIGTLELRREVTDPQEVADLPGFATHGALGHAERRTELISGHAWLARGVGQEVDMSQRIHHPSRPRGTAAACSGEGRLRASFATARRARSAYSSSRTERTDRHTESVMPNSSGQRPSRLYGAPALRGELGEVQLGFVPVCEPDDHGGMPAYGFQVGVES